jgi:hypothetical protein
MNILMTLLPKAIVRIYLIDGEFKTIVIDANLNTRECIRTMREKLALSKERNYLDHLLYEVVKNGEGKKLILYLL